MTILTIVQKLLEAISPTWKIPQTQKTRVLSSRTDFSFSFRKDLFAKKIIRIQTEEERKQYEKNTEYSHHSKLKKEGKRVQTKTRLE